MEGNFTAGAAAMGEEGEEDGAALFLATTEAALADFNGTGLNASVLSQEKDTPACMLFKFTLYTIAMGILCVLGFAGNTLSFLVLRKDLSTPVASFLLEVLAIADNVLLVLWFVHYSIREGSKFFGFAWIAHPAWIYIRVYTFPVMYMAQMATIWLTVVIALNRYMAVCLPYRAPQLCNINNVYKGVSGVILFSVCYNLPRFFEIRVIHQPGGGGNGGSNGTAASSSASSAAVTWNRTSLGSNGIYDLVYVDVLYYVFTFVLPLLMLAFVNTRVTIAYQVIRRRKRRMTSRRQENENNITLVMIIIVLIFMLCQAPARIVQLVWSYNYRHCQTYPFYLIHISNTLEVLNSSVNFVVYFSFRKRFRDIVWTSFCFAPLTRLRQRAGGEGGRPTTTTEGLSLVQIEQTTATMMHDINDSKTGAHPPPPQPPPPAANQTTTTAITVDIVGGQQQQPPPHGPNATGGGAGQKVNGECTKGVNVADEENDDEEEGGGQDGEGQPLTGQEQHCHQGTLPANGVAEQCLQSADDELAEDFSPETPLRP